VNHHGAVGKKRRAERVGDGAAHAEKGRAATQEGKSCARHRPGARDRQAR